MDKLIEGIKQVIPFWDVHFKVGLLFIVLGIIIGVFKQYWLIAGVNTMSKKKKKNIDLAYLGKYFGLFSVVFGFLTIFCSILFIHLDMKYEYRALFFHIITFGFVVFIFWYFYGLKKDRVFKKNERNDYDTVQ